MHNTVVSRHYSAHAAISLAPWEIVCCCHCFQESNDLVEGKRCPSEQEIYGVLPLSFVRGISQHVPHILLRTIPVLSSSGCADLGAIRLQCATKSSDRSIPILTHKLCLTKKQHRH